MHFIERVLLTLFISFFALNSFGQMNPSHLKQLAILPVQKVDEYALRLDFELTSTKNEGEKYKEWNFEQSSTNKTLKVVRYKALGAKEATLTTNDKKEYLLAVDFCSANNFKLEESRMATGGHISKLYRKGNIFLRISSWKNGVDDLNYYQVHINVVD